MVAPTSPKGMRIPLRRIVSVLGPPTATAATETRQAIREPGDVGRPRLGGRPRVEESARPALAAGEAADTALAAEVFAASSALPRCWRLGGGRRVRRPVGAVWIAESIDGAVVHA